MVCGSENHLCTEGEGGRNRVHGGEQEGYTPVLCDVKLVEFAAILWFPGPTSLSAFRTLIMFV